MRRPRMMKLLVGHARSRVYRNVLTARRLMLRSDTQRVVTGYSRLFRRARIEEKKIREGKKAMLPLRRVS